MSRNRSPSPDRRPRFADAVPRMRRAGPAHAGGPPGLAGRGGRGPAGPPLIEEDLSRSALSHAGSGHFLERALRCEGADLDRAMRLYHHAEQVRQLLPGMMAFFPDADRAAVPLRDALPSPHVIVTREGRFVTCLSEGMPVRDLPVLSYRKFAEAMDRADAVQELGQRRRQQLAELSGDQLFAALWAGPGHLTREMAAVIARQPDTYLLAVLKTLFTAAQGLVAWLNTELEAGRATRKMHLRTRHRDATVRLCLYLLGGIEHPELSGLTYDALRNGSDWQFESFLVLARQADGGDRLLDLAVDAEAPPGIAQRSPAFLMHHLLRHPGDALRLVRRARGLPPSPGLDLMNLLIERLFDALGHVEDPRKLVAGLRDIGATTPAQPLAPERPCWILNDDELLQVPLLNHPLEDYFPPAAICAQVRDAFNQRIHREPLWEAPRPKVAQVVRQVPRVGRNQACPCGSGRKFKQCCIGKSAEIDGTEAPGEHHV